MTLVLLWQEYRAAHAGRRTWAYTQFCEHYKAFAKTLKRSMRQQRRAGEKLFIDYAGPTLALAAREQRDAVPALLSDPGAAIAGGLDLRARKLRIGRLDLLQLDNIGPGRVEPRQQLHEALAKVVDVPGRDSHRRRLAPHSSLTANPTCPDAPGSNEPVKVHSIAPVAPTPGIALSVQAVIAAGSGAAQVADRKVVNAGVPSVIRIDPTAALPRLV